MLIISYHMSHITSFAYKTRQDNTINEQD